MPALVADSDLTGYSATVSVVEVGVVTVGKWSRAFLSQRQVLCTLLIALSGRVVFVYGGLAAWNVLFCGFLPRWLTVIPPVLLRQREPSRLPTVVRLRASLDVVRYLPPIVLKKYIPRTIIYNRFQYLPKSLTFRMFCFEPLFSSGSSTVCAAPRLYAVARQRTGQRMHRIYRASRQWHSLRTGRRSRDR